MASLRKKNAPESAPPQDFEGSLTQLEQIVKSLEQGNLGLEQSLESYERAVRTLRICYEYLQQAERKIEVLRGVREDGSASTQSFEDSDDDLREKQTSRSRRRSADGD